MTDSPVRCTIDVDAPGRQVGRLEVPSSSNSAAWSSVVVPIVSVANGEGPTVLVVGGVHGDEPEGQIAALNLVRRTEDKDVRGRLLVVPCASPAASRAATRLWPSGANLNRSFPGSPTGSTDEQLADYLTTELIARSDAIIDLHSGGRSSYCPAWSEMHWMDDAEQRDRTVAAMFAWNFDYHFIYIDIAGTGLLVGEAERQGKTVGATELGGGYPTATIHRLARDGLDNVLRHLGVLEGKVVTRDTLGLPPPRILRALDIENYVLSPVTGLWETFVEIGDEVERGQPIGQLHSFERPGQDPEMVRSMRAGRICGLRAIAMTAEGDNLATVGQEISREDLR